MCGGGGVCVCVCVGGGGGGVLGYSFLKTHSFVQFSSVPGITDFTL